MRLLTRNTRSVAPTEAAERLVQTVGPHFNGIDAGLAALTALRKFLPFGDGIRNASCPAHCRPSRLGPVRDMSANSGSHFVVCDRLVGAGGEPPDLSRVRAFHSCNKDAERRASMNRSRSLDNMKG